MATERSTGSTRNDIRARFTQYLKDFGTTISVIRSTDTVDSMGRITAVATATTTLVKCDIQWVNKKDLSNISAGDIRIGDGIIYVEHDADIILEDEITFDSEQWRVVSQVEGEVVSGGKTYKAYIIRRNVQS